MFWTGYFRIKKLELAQWAVSQIFEKLPFAILLHFLICDTSNPLFSCDSIAYIHPNMINVDAVDFRECRSEEVISFFWRFTTLLFYTYYTFSMFVAKLKGRICPNFHIEKEKQRFLWYRVTLLLIRWMFISIHLLVLFSGACVSSRSTQLHRVLTRPSLPRRAVMSNDGRLKSDH